MNFAVIVRDLSAQKAFETQLTDARDVAEKAARAKSNFLANMSHEIRTPLNGVIGVAGALGRTSLTPRQSEMLKLIEESARSLEHLLNEILDLAKTDAGRNEVVLKEFDLAKTIRKAFNLFKESNQNESVCFICEMDESVCGIFLGDEHKIQQILNNILSNSKKFTRAGAIKVHASETQSDRHRQIVRIAISDTGVGFPPEKADQLFDRFEQADNTITRQFGGTGLGLAITKSLVELMGGTISANSDGHAGATFTVELPLERRPVTPPATSDTQDPHAPEADQRLRILIADDHPMNRQVVQWMLDDISVDLTDVANGLEAVEATANNRFDLILMDVQMPVMDGLTAIRHIRRNDDAQGCERVPICVLTANSSRESEIAAYDAGADYFLTKPLSAGNIIQLIQTLFCEKQSQPGAATH